MPELTDLLSQDFNRVSAQAMTRQFHGIFGHPVSNKPKQLSKKQAKSRWKFIQSEVDELKQAIEGRDFKETIDALADITYFVYGTFTEMGVNGHVMFARVHQSNLSKLWPNDVAEDVLTETLAQYDLKPEDVHFKPSVIDGLRVCYRNSDDKVVKGPNFQAPDFSDIEAQMRVQAANQAN